VDDGVWGAQMIKMKFINRIFLLITGHAAGYMIVSGINGLNIWATICYTITFGILVLSCLLLMLFGFEILNNSLVVIVTTLVPLSLALGIITTYLPAYKFVYLIFAILGLIFIYFTKTRESGKLATSVLAGVHGLAGLIITFLPVTLSLKGVASPWFSLVGLGGALIGITGLLLTFLKMEKTILSQRLIYNIFPVLLLAVTTLFAVGLSLD
jgi:hypothetical protein